MTPADSRSGTEAVLFDLDGTFADTLPDLAAALAAASGEHDAASLQRMRHLVSFGGRRMVAEVLGAGADAQRVDQVREAFLHHYREHIAERTRPFPGIPELVSALERRGLRWGIVTNKLAWLTEPLVAALAIEPHCVVSGDSAARAKPHPDPLLLGARQLRAAAPRCVYVGDAHNDVVAARAAGMPALVAGWGYLPRHDAACDWGAQQVIDAPAAVLRWIDRHRR